MRDPELMRRVMSRYFDEMRAALEGHGGTVEKFIGDAVMAVFGTPVLHEDDALRALRAALEMRDRLATLNDELEESFGLRLEIRIGVCTGEVVAGDPTRGETFVTGDSVVVAQRLQAAAEPGEILVADSTYRLARDEVRAEPLEPLELKGKAKPVQALQAAGARLGWAGRAASPLADGRAGPRAAAPPGRVRTRGSGPHLPPLHRPRPRRRRQVAPALGGNGRDRRARARPLRQLPPVRRGNHLPSDRGDRRPGVRGGGRARRDRSGGRRRGCRGRRRARHLDRRPGRLRRHARGGVLGRAPAVRVARAGAAARRRLRRHQLGRADAPRPDRARRRLGARRAAARRLHGSTGAARRAWLLGRREAQRDLDLPRAARRRPRPAGSPATSSGAARCIRTSPPGSSARPAATRSSSRRWSRSCSRTT